MLAASGLLAGGVSTAQALDTFFVGPRAMGMAGANVASTSDTTAQYYNPAAFGFFDCRDRNGDKIACDNNNIGRKQWGADLNATAGYRLHNEFGVFLDDLADIDRDQLSSASVQNESDLADLIDLVKGLEGIDEPGNAITATVNAGLGVRFGHFAIGGRGFAQATGVVLEVDSNNLGLTGSTDFNAEINAIAITGNDLQTLLFTPDQQAQLAATGLDATAIQRLDFMARRQGVKTANSQGFVDLMADLSAQSAGGGGAIEDNTTTVLLTGFALGEVPLSYGYALNDHWAIGGNLKLMVGRVYGNQVLVFNEDSGDILKSTDEEYEETYNVGVDLGIMGRYRLVNLGLVARNLNAPKFDGPTVNGVTFDDVKVDPQVTAGIALIPHETLVIEVDCDLTENETSFEDYKTQNVAIGLEWDALRAVALRAGVYKNLAEDDIDWVYTAGLGFNLWGVRLDVAGAFANETEEFDGDDIPKETRLAAQLSMDF
ncbi:hypothetical protein DESUT3_16290 [Desulfuromonas versatilis]|uniref:Conjugal transfer protein TraF n=1 Tax=Desulfuromonas versatilis TaxID=2802975 RepID=A0ABN6DWY5_9BACT|nr:hypothetical protein DESUT3_16290 [Desulfuromonas versatilis]